MPTTHKSTPRQIARKAIESNRKWIESGLVTADEAYEQLIMLGIAAYNDASNQRPENLSETCRRLGVNLHWMDVRDLRSDYQIHVGGSVHLARTDLGAAELLEKLYRKASKLSATIAADIYVKAAL